MVAQAARNLINALKGNFAKAHDKTKLGALDHLAIFLVEPSVLVTDEVELMGPSPRVENAPCPRVEHTKHTPNGPLPLIPADSNDDNSSNNDVYYDEDNNDQEDDDAGAPRHNKQAQAAKKRQPHSNVTREAVLSVLEMSQQNFEPKSLTLRCYPLAFLCELEGSDG
eukprot:CCRYP_010928-RA/>CCRYP_010928-RA protein AED:0.41 eAED:0.41 QI:0/0/0/1/1/1/2/0/166